ncbi:MAG: glycosyltransferase family 4 protein [Candidatus Micrarchaeia archaeon]
MKKVIFMLPSLEVGGAETFACNLSEDLKAKGFSILLFSLKRKENHVNIIDIDEKYVRYGIGPLEFISLVLKEKPDVIVTFMPKCNILFQPLCRLLFVPSLSIKAGENRHYGFFRRKFYAFSDFFAGIFSNRFVVKSETGKKELISEFVSKGKIVVIPNYVDGVAEKKTYFIDENPKILYVGRLHKVKNAVLLLKALKYAKTKPELHIVGYGEMLDELVELAKPLKNKIAFYGKMSNIWVKSHIRNYDLFVLPSLVEGCPGALLEAMSAGIPVLASNIPENREVLAEMEELLFACDDEIDLAKKIDWIFGLSTKEREVIGQRLKQISRRYSKDKVVRAYTEVLNAIIRKR